MLHNPKRSMGLAATTPDIEANMAGQPFSPQWARNRSIWPRNAMTWATKHLWKIMLVGHNAAGGKVCDVTDKVIKNLCRTSSNRKPSPVTTMKSRNPEGKVRKKSPKLDFLLHILEHSDTPMSGLLMDDDKDRWMKELFDLVCCCSDRKPRRVPSCWWTDRTSSPISSWVKAAVNDERRNIELASLWG